MKGFKIIVLLLVVFASGFLFPVNSFVAAPVQEELKSIIDRILIVLRDPALKGDDTKEQRRNLLRSIVSDNFSFEKMSQMCLAKHWRKRSDQEKKVFVEMFGQLLEETYISKVESFTDEKIVFVKEFLKNRKALIYTKVITDTIEIPINYRMYQTKQGDWMVYDIVIEGVSLVANYRSQFASILKKGSYEQLVKDLKKKLDE